MAVQFSFRSCFATFFACAAWSAGASALSLAEAERELLSGNHDIALAASGVDAARASIAVAAQAPNPTLSVQSTQYSPIAGLGAGRPGDKALDTVVGISVPLERGDKAKLRRDAASGLYDGARNDLREARRQQRLALHFGYYDVKLAGERLAIARETRELAGQALAAADRRVAAGDLAPVDRHRLAVDALRAANDLTAAGADLRQSRLALALLLGRIAEAKARGATSPDGAAAPDDFEATDPWPAVEAATPSEPASLEARADIAGAQARVQAAMSGRALARSLRDRDVTVGAQIERSPGTGPGLLYGVNISIPLFVNYHYDGEQARAEADYTTAVLARRKALAQAQAEIAKARAGLESARQRLQDFEAGLLPAARKALDAVEYAYSRGAAPLTDVLDARRTWRSTQADLAAARADHAKARAAWLAATEWETTQ